MKLFLAFIFITNLAFSDDYMLVHGLNTAQNMLDDIEKLLEQNGHKVHRLILSGHHKDDWKAFLSVSSQQWENDFVEKYNEMKGQKHLIAYSLGAVTAVYTQVHNDTVRFKSQMFFAPAFDTRWYVNLVKTANWFGAEKLKSFAKENERVHSYTSMAAYNTLFEMRDFLKKETVKVPQTPTKVFMDKKDKLVSYSGVKNWIANKKLDWEMVSLNSSRSDHHMVILRKYLDDRSWEKIEKQFTE